MVGKDEEIRKEQIERKRNYVEPRMNEGNIKDGKGKQKKLT
jgi:hypothetical protein